MPTKIEAMEMEQKEQGAKSNKAIPNEEEPFQTDLAGTQCASAGSRKNKDGQLQYVCRAPEYTVGERKITMPFFL